MRDEDRAGMAKSFEHFRQTGDWLWEYIDPEIELVNFETFPITERYYGHDGFRQWFSDLWAEVDGFSYEVVEFLGEGPDAAAVRLRISGKLARGGADFDFRWPTVLWFRDGKTIRAQGFVDDDEALRAVQTPAAELVRGS
jgi:ketosteroid isomerase-like protein